MDAFDFLETLPNATLERLYEDPWACQAVFQALPALAQQFVLRLLASESPVPRQLLESWVLPVGGRAGAGPNGRPQMPAAFHYALEKVPAYTAVGCVARDARWADDEGGRASSWGSASSCRCHRTPSSRTRPS